MQRLADALPAERAASRFIVSTDPDEHVAAIMRYVDLGFTNLIFHAPGPDQARFLRLYGEEILPRLRPRRADRMTALDPATLSNGDAAGPAPGPRRRDARPAEAEVLLGARGDACATCARSAGRVRDAGLLAAGRPGRHHLLAQGVHPGHPAVPRPLPLLHLRDHAEPAAGRVPVARTRSSRSPRQGARPGCKEALFTLGDRPEDRWPAAREWLDAHGYDDTLAYVRAMAIRVLEETGLLPHLNPGVHDLAGLPAAQAGRAVDGHDARDHRRPGCSPSRSGAALRLARQGPGRAAAGARGRRPLGVPFTTGILIGIGETLAERVDSLFAIRRIARDRITASRKSSSRTSGPSPTPRWPGCPTPSSTTWPRRSPSPGWCSGPKMRIQAPPNLIDDEYALLIARRHRRLGRRLAAHARPRQSRAPVAADRGAGRAHRGRRVHAARAAHGLPRVRPRRRAVARSAAAAARPRAGRPQTGLAVDGRDRRGPALAGARRGLDGRGPGRPAHRDRHRGPHRRPAQRLRRGLRRLGRACARRWCAPSRAGPRRLATSRAALRHAEADPAGLSDADALALFARERPGPRRARRPRRRAAPRHRRRRRHLRRQPQHQLHQRLLHRLPVLRVRPAPHRRRRLHALARRGRPTGPTRPGQLGATEVCMQGGIHPDLPGTAYFDIAREIKTRVPEHARARVQPDGGRQRRRRAPACRSASG